MIFIKGHNSKKVDNSDKKKHGSVIFYDDAICEISKL